jgi:hypothetical protein
MPVITLLGFLKRCGTSTLVAMQGAETFQALDVGFVFCYHNIILQPMVDKTIGKLPMFLKEEIILKP